MLTVKEALEKAKIGRTTFYKLVKDRRLRLYKIGSRSLVNGDELMCFLINLPTTLD